MILCSCGDRLCRKCYQSKISDGLTEFRCSLCATEVLVTDCFRDRAVSMEMKVASIQCTSLHCPWQGRSVEYEDHLKTCKFAIISCPHSTYGCKQEFCRSEISLHMEECQYKPVKCKWCHKYTAEESVSVIQLLEAVASCL